MPDLANGIRLSPPPAGEVRTGDLLQRLEPHPQAALIFSYEGHTILPGYHVTEVKEGYFEGLDCGANPEAWRETFIQLWDVPSADGRSHMPVGKFLAILRKVQETVPFDPNAKLTFEVSGDEGAIRLYRAESVSAGIDTVTVALAQRRASCKPRDRWLDEQKATSCCASETASCCA